MHRDKTDAISLALSAVLHALLILAMTNILIKSNPRQVALITDVTLIDSKELQGNKGQEEKVIGLEQQQKKMPEAIKEKTVKKTTAKVTTAKELLKKIEKQKEMLDTVGISKENLKQESEKTTENQDDQAYEQGGEVVAGGAPTVTGQLATRKYKKIEWSFPKKLPEETELEIEVVVQANGIISSVQLIRTSGYPELDKAALSQARKLQFEPLPEDAKQEDEAGILLFKFGAEK